MGRGGARNPLSLDHGGSRIDPTCSTYLMRKLRPGACPVPFLSLGSKVSIDGAAGILTDSPSVLQSLPLWRDPSELSIPVHSMPCRQTSRAEGQWGEPGGWLWRPGSSSSSASSVLCGFEQVPSPHWALVSIHRKRRKRSGCSTEGGPAQPGCAK